MGAVERGNMRRGDALGQHFAAAVERRVNGVRAATEQRSKLC